MPCYPAKYPLRVVILCTIVGGYGCVRAKCCLHLHSKIEWGWSRMQPVYICRLQWRWCHWGGRWNRACNISTTLQIITTHRSKYEAKSTKTRELVKSFLLCLGYVLSSMPYTFAIKHLGTQAQSGICLGTGQIICLYFSVWAFCASS